MQIIIKALAIYKTIEVSVVKYQAKNLKNQINFSIQFLSNNDGLLYLAIKNVYLALIVGFVSYLIFVSN